MITIVNFYKLWGIWNWDKWKSLRPFQIAFYVSHSFHKCGLSPYKRFLCFCMKWKEKFPSCTKSSVWLSRFWKYTASVTWNTLLSDYMTIISKLGRFSCLTTCFLKVQFYCFVRQDKYNIRYYMYLYVLLAKCQYKKQ